MKKSIAITLASSLIMLVATPVLATNVKTDLTDTYSNTIDIMATTSGSDKYSVDVEWGDMTFEYNVGGWDTTNHEYTTEASAVWTSKTDGDASEDALNTATYTTLGSGQILVRNHSNQPVKTEYSVATTDTEGFENVVPSVTEGGVIEACPVLGTSGNEGVPYQTAEVTLSGAPTYRQENVKVGTLTISISEQ